MKVNEKVGLKDGVWLCVETEEVIQHPNILTICTLQHAEKSPIRLTLSEIERNKL